MKKNIKTNPFLKTVKILFIIISVLLLLSGAFATGYVIKISSGIDYSADERLFELSRGSRTTILYYNDKSELSNILDEFSALESYVPRELENGRVMGAENAIWCEYKDIPDNLKNAFIAIEDHRFFSHNGVDWLRSAKAMLNYFLNFDSRFGGSSITQQLIKNISEDKEISVERKIREILRAINIERKYTKEDILELYLNIVPMSENCVGVNAAAEKYFSKKPSELTLCECASLAAITNSPNFYNPINNLENNTHRRNLVLQSMLEYGYISNEDFTNAISTDTVLLVSDKNEANKTQSWYVETVLDDVINDLVEQKDLSYDAAFNLVYSGGLKIYTLMDKEIQEYLENYFSNTYNFPRECRYSDLQYAMTVIDQRNGALLGVAGAVGSKNANRVMNYATKALMPPGSAIKPISVYAPALEEGIINWATVFDDTPVTFYKYASRMIPWPNNYPAIYSGLTDVNTALAYSKNTVAVKIYNLLGAERSYSYLVNKLHVKNIVRSYESEGSKYTDLASAPLALGQLSLGATLRDMTSAYTSFYDGNYRKCRSYLAVYDSMGNLILENKESAEYVWSPQNASIMTEMLQNVVSYGTARDINLKYTLDTAGKTGTSGDDRDRWFIGYTPYLTAGIWCGYPERDKSVGDLSKTHLEIWDEVMKHLHRNILNNQESAVLNFKLADGVIKCSYCKDSGKLYSDVCKHDPRGTRCSYGYFTKWSAPASFCDRHILVDYNTEGRGVLNVGEDTPSFEDENIKTEKIALIREYKRDFPVQIYISDAQYVYRALNGNDISIKIGTPFFANTIKNGHFIGLSPAKDGRQFNEYYKMPSADEEKEKEETEEKIDSDKEDASDEESTEYED